MWMSGYQPADSRRIFPHPYGLTSINGLRTRELPPGAAQLLHEIATEPLEGAAASPEATNWVALPCYWYTRPQKADFIPHILRCSSFRNLLSGYWNKPRGIHVWRAREPKTNLSEVKTCRS